MSAVADPLLEVSDLSKHFPIAGGWLRPPRAWIRAVDGVSLAIEPGEVVALVGESGCGKSTLALTIAGLEHATSGMVYFRGQEITQASGSGVEPGLKPVLKPILQEVRREIQLIFQDPYESLNPLMSVEEIVAEPLAIHRLASTSQQRRERVVAALESAGLRPASAFLPRHPHELSGGQRQRVAIAAALVLEPALLLADEPVSMLDVSVRAEILNLLSDLRRTRGISILFITHDLSTVAMFADRIAVMYLGRIVETGPAREVVEHPKHPYTQALLSVVPVANPRLRRDGMFRRAILPGETPHPGAIPSGCRFHPRCPLAMAQCAQVEPPAVTVGPDHTAVCLLFE
jgi:oligopeptide/dipeptide ABC transporter ATP-binding protein